MNLKDRIDIIFNRNFFVKGYDFKIVYNANKFNDKFMISFDINIENLNDIHNILYIEVYKIDKIMGIQSNTRDKVYVLENMQTNKVKINNDEYKMSATLTYSVTAR